MAQMVAMESIDLNDTTVTIPAELPEEQIHIETAEERWILFFGDLLTDSIWKITIHC